MGNGKPTRVWIFRDGDKRLRVSPSPVILSPGQDFQVRNFAQGDAVATFPGWVLDGSPQVRISGDKKPVNLKVSPNAPPDYFDYEVKIGTECAIGGSSPGGLIDP